MTSPASKAVILFLFISLGIALLFQVVLWHLSDGFILSKISSPLSKASYHEESEAPTHIDDILNQSFHYLDKGSQCYVFASEDGKYVLKFFRFNRYRLPSFQKYLILPPFIAEIQKQRIQLKEEKIRLLRESCRIAYQQLRDDAGLVYLHLNKTTHLNQKIRIYDKLKREYTIDADHFCFYVQKRGEHIYPYLLRLLKEGRRDEVKTALTDLVQLLNRRIQKNITDHDAVIHKNSGFLEGKPFFLDVGQFAWEESEDPHQEIFRLTRPLECWLRQRDLDLCF